MKEQAQQYYKEIKEDNYWQDRDDIIEFLYNYQIENGADFGIVTDDELDEMVKNESMDGWQRVAYFLANVENMNEEFYRINGYGNAEDIKERDIECALYDIVNGYYD